MRRFLLLLPLLAGAPALAQTPEPTPRWRPEVRLGAQLGTQDVLADPLLGGMVGLRLPVRVGPNTLALEPGFRLGRALLTENNRLRERVKSLDLPVSLRLTLKSDRALNGGLLLGYSRQWVRYQKFSVLDSSPLGWSAYSGAHGLMIGGGLDQPLSRHFLLGIQLAGYVYADENIQANLTLYMSLRR